MTLPMRIIRPDLGTLSPYNAGLSIAEIQTRYRVDEVAKLGSNENPYGPAPQVIAAINTTGESVYLYPESNGGDLRKAVAEHYNLEPDSLIFGNGSEELLSIICRSVINPADRVVTLYPSFPLHEDYAVMMGGVIERVPLKDDLTINLDALIEAVKRPAKMVVFANPINPVGSWLTPGDLQQVIARTHQDTLLVLDEAYYEYALLGDYCTGLDHLRPDTGHWIVLRTFSKAWGLAGLRVGFGVCSSHALRAALDLTRTPFNTNVVGQIAAMTALQQSAHMVEHVAIVHNERQRVEQSLHELGYEFASSLGNFLFVDVKQNGQSAFNTLLASGVITKPWRQAGFENYLRISIGTPRSNDLMLSAVARDL